MPEADASPQTDKKLLGDVLLASGLISSEQRENLRFESINAARSEEDLVKEKGWVGATELAQAKAKLLGFSFVTLVGRTIEKDILGLIPEPLARTSRVMPLEKKGGKIRVAMVDPLDLPTIEVLERSSQMSVEPVMAEESDLEAALERLYGTEKMEAEISEAVEAAVPTTKIEEQIKKMDEAEDVIREAPVSRIVSVILEFAVKSRASDIHIEPQEDVLRVRYRIDGVLRERLSLPRRIHPSIIARVKILANLRLDEHRLPQDGRFKIEMKDKKVDLRISILPTIFGEKIVIRLLQESNQLLTLEQLGLRGISLARMQEALRFPNGIILVTGPTGSGKTYTLASAVSQINKVGVNIITLEDPVEIRIPGVNQVQINPAVGLTFASGLRSILRQDPNVIMVGEIRDTETAELAIHAALTGHLVFSTLHTNSAPGALPRLLDMNVEPYLLTSTVNAILAQRLVRTICKDCKKAIPTPPEVLAEMKEALGPLFENFLPKEEAAGKSGEVMIYKGEGCETCGGQGYKGRTAVFEVLTNSETISRLVLEHQPTQAIEAQAIKEGMVTLKQDGYQKVLEGITTVEEIIRVTRED